MRILIITNTIPYPPVSGGRIRLYNLLRRIAERHDVWLATHLHTPDEIEGVPHLQEFCQGVITGLLKRRHPLVHLPELIRYVLAGNPPELKFHYCQELSRKLSSLLEKITFDVVQIEESFMALYLELLPPKTQSKRILSFYDIGFDQAAYIARVTRHPLLKQRIWLHSQMMRRWEGRYAERFDCCISVSQADRQLLLAVNPKLRVEVIPNGVDAQRYQPLPHGQSIPALLFIGDMSYLPCIDAALYFCHEILPHIRRNMGYVELWIVGKDPLPEIQKLNGGGVHVTGRVNDIIPYYQKSSASVTPLRAGGGTRLKILEAMALGRPVISTTIGCQGLDVRDGEHLLVADNPRQFAEKTVCLLTNQPLYQQITANAREMVTRRYDWQIIAQQLMQVYMAMQYQQEPY